MGAFGRFQIGIWGRRGGSQWAMGSVGSLTVLVGGVVHAVGAVAVVGDVGFGFGTRGVQHPGLDVGPPGFGERPRVHREVGADLPQHPCVWGGVRMGVTPRGGGVGRR